MKEFAALAELPLENLCAMCTAHLSGIYRYLAGLAPLDLETARADGRRRAEQGMPLPVVLHGYRIGALFIWESLRDEADL
ncbi:hypothetical protein ACFYWS_26055 [Streptomyces sp. NPDC002795]|uniref:hypothetical protein n=1 Tax=Streptomyces sp. NPDC002795 TaxID=3364665 RepID=UPI0036ABADB4